MLVNNRISKEWLVPKECTGQSVRDFLIKRGHFSRQLWKKVRTEGCVVLNQEKVGSRQPVQEGDLITVYFPEESQGATMNPVPGPLSIMYEDEDLIVLNKPSGIAVLPPIDKSKPSIANWLLAHYEEQRLPVTVHIVTRLDQFTSGLMVIAKHAYSHMLLTKKEKQISRYYQAIVEGQVAEESGEINLPIGRAEGSIIERAIHENGKPSVTLYNVAESNLQYSRLHLQLLTGRTHQIRVHMASLGHPLVGDTLYGASETELVEGQALHCDRIEFVHPWTKEELYFSVDTPHEWQSLVVTD
ncbi:RluA family pseudouridine synthase [Halobacillus locisalis]|uniref:Pseudouridine synthase n=2 Tax=Halobacillus locisalis TaxID=220753 RepID=A0A838CRI5_9BACI|nr:RluA family pseudouridine synthase [Halobacillus locisalis]